MMNKLKKIINKNYNLLIKDIMLDNSEDLINLIKYYKTDVK